jgi:hypothetical protein
MTTIIYPEVRGYDAASGVQTFFTDVDPSTSEDDAVGDGDIWYDTVNGNLRNLWDETLNDGNGGWVAVRGAISTLVNEAGTTLADGDVITSQFATGPVNTNRFEISMDHIAGLNEANQVQVEIRAGDGKLVAGGGDVMLDSNGISIITATSQQLKNTIKWVTGSFNNAEINTYLDSLASRSTSIFSNYGGTTNHSKMTVQSFTTKSGGIAQSQLIANAEGAQAVISASSGGGIESQISLSADNVSLGYLQVAADLIRLLTNTEIVGVLDVSANLTAVQVSATLDGTNGTHIDTDRITIGGAASVVTGTNFLLVRNGTAPANNVADAFSMYSADIAAGKACAHFRMENGDIVKLFKADALATAALTNVSGTVPVTYDYGWGGGTTGGVGFATVDEFRTMVQVILSLQRRTNQLEVVLQGSGQLA